MLRKWEYIAKRCDGENKKEAAKIAREIDGVLVELYPDILFTNDWEEEYKTFDNMAVPHIASGYTYCVACEIHDECNKCKFGIKTGMCGCEETSLYNQWFYVYDE